MVKTNTLLVVGAVVIGGLFLTGNLGGSANASLPGIFGGGGRSTPTNQGNQLPAIFQQGSNAPVNGGGTGGTSLVANSFDEDIGVAPNPTQRGIFSVSPTVFSGAAGSNPVGTVLGIRGPGFTTEPVRVTAGGSLEPVRQAIEAGTGRISTRRDIDVRVNAVNVHSRPRVVEREPGTGRPSFVQ